MADILKWNSFSFYAKASAIQGIRDITIRASTETEDGTANGENFVSRTASNPYEITFTAILNQLLGVNVKATATGLTEAARKSEKGYIYMAGAKLFTCQFMATEAEIDSLEIAPNGTWISCEVRMTMRQCSKYDGSIVPSQAANTSGGGGGGGGGSAPAATKTTKKSTSGSTAKKSTTTTKPTGTSIFKKVVEAAKNEIASISNFLSNAKTQSKTALNNAAKYNNNKVDAITSAAPKASTAKTTTTKTSVLSSWVSKAPSSFSKIVSVKKK